MLNAALAYNLHLCSGACARLVTDLGIVEIRMFSDEREMLSCWVRKMQLCRLLLCILDMDISGEIRAV
jgi:hypothetical protein